MRKFKFRLQTVLDQRKAIEDKLMAELGELRHREAEECARLEAIIDERARLWRRMESAEFSFAQARDAEAYASALTDDIRIQHLTIEAVRKQIEQKLAEVVEASKERKLVEKLREKHFEEYQREMLDLEQKSLDEGASVRFARKAA